MISHIIMYHITVLVFASLFWLTDHRSGIRRGRRRDGRGPRRRSRPTRGTCGQGERCVFRSDRYRRSEIHKLAICKNKGNIGTLLEC